MILFYRKMKCLLKFVSLGVPQCSSGAKDPALSLLWLRSLLWCGFNPRPGNFCMLQVKPKNKVCVPYSISNWQNLNLPYFNMMILRYIKLKHVYLLNESLSNKNRAKFLTFRMYNTTNIQSKFISKYIKNKLFLI